MSNPIWIKVDGGDTFEGHQGHWADCFFYNATSDNIQFYGTGFGNRSDETIEIREMTEEEVLKYPEAVIFRDMLIKEYGEE